MQIDENTYITVTNRVKVSMAIHAVRDVLPGFDGVITDDERKQVMKILCKWEDELFAKINEEHDDGADG